ncbi:MAG: alpha,alpha-trehalose-phosphate synthase (UDP-forming) [Acidimicrobiia bacterium]
MIVVSHRGPYTFFEDQNGTLETRRGAGGVVSALGPLVHGNIAELSSRTTWIAAAIGPGDRRAAQQGITAFPGVDLLLLDLPVEQHRLHYDVASNEVLWFLHHGIFDLVHAPNFDPAFDDAWAAYRSINAQFADAVCAHADEGELVFVQDYQLALVPAYVLDRRPDLRVLHFHHIPFCGPNSIRVLPDAIAFEYLNALSRTRIGFHSERWANAYRASAHEILGDREIAAPYVAQLGPDLEALESAAHSPEAAEAIAWLDACTRDHVRIVRTDRVEPTKNLVRGFAAYELFLEQHPEWAARVTFVTCAYRSRESISLYRKYADEVTEIAARINARFGTPDWEPIVFDVRDDHARSVAAMAHADVVLVNPLKDGLNLVALEAAAINARDGIVICSRDAGAFDVLEAGVLGINPFDIEGTADAIATAVTMASDARHKLAATARQIATSASPTTWLRDCLAAARR